MTQFSEWPEGYFGTDFTGHVPNEHGLKGKNAVSQFVTLWKSWDYSSFDVTCEVSANRKSVYLNCLFWKQHDFSDAGISEHEKAVFIENLKKVWEFNHIETPLPGGF